MSAPTPTPSNTLASNLFLFNAYRRIPGFRHQFTVRFSGSSHLMWTVLALTWLDQKLPSLEEAWDLFITRETPVALELRQDFDEFVGVFSNEAQVTAWRLNSLRDSQRIMAHLARRLGNFEQECAGEAINRMDHEFSYLWAIVSSFVSGVHQQQLSGNQASVSTWGMLYAIGNIMSLIGKPLISHTIGWFNAFEPHTRTDRRLDRFRRVVVHLLCERIENYLREQPASFMAGEHFAHVNPGETFVQLVRQPLLRHVNHFLDMLFHDLGYYSYNGRVVDDQSPEVQRRVGVFFLQVAWFFSYASPLFLRHFSVNYPEIEDLGEWSELGTEDEDEGMSEDEAESVEEPEEESVEEEFVEEESEDDVSMENDQLMESDESDDEDAADLPEHVARHEFEQYEDADWFSAEMELFDVEDVLTGPEVVELDDVSYIMGSLNDLSCMICGDSDPEVEMRILALCTHGICSDCLRTQLDTEHASRYRCAICRAEFFPSASAA